MSLRKRLVDRVTRRAREQEDALARVDGTGPEEARSLIERAKAQLDGDKTATGFKAAIERALGHRLIRQGERGSKVLPQPRNRAERRALKRASRKHGRGYTHQHGTRKLAAAPTRTSGDPGKIAPRHAVKKGYVPTAQRGVIVEQLHAVKKPQLRDIVKAHQAAA